MTGRSLTEDPKRCIRFSRGAPKYKEKKNIHCEVRRAVSQQKVEQRAEATHFGPLGKRVAGGFRQLKSECLACEELVEHQGEKRRCGKEDRRISNLGIGRKDSAKTDSRRSS